MTVRRQWSAGEVQRVDELPSELRKRIEALEKRVAALEGLKR